MIRRDDYAYEQSCRLVDRLFGGRIAPFVAQFYERQNLSRREIEELRRLIED
jgi:predicted transcriptional regulator